MRLASVTLARTLAYIEAFDLDPRGKVFLPDLVRELVERYRFHKFPAKIEEFDISKGIVFEDGKIGGKVIQKFSIFDVLLVLETRSNTSESKQLIEEMLLWGAAKFGFNYSDGAIKRNAYVSGVSFYSDAPILSLNPFVDALTTRMNGALSDIWQQPMRYEPLGFAVGHDPQSRKDGIAQFTLAHRAGSRWSENKYYSEAPLPTDLHLALLEEYETGMRKFHGGRMNGH